MTQPRVAASRSKTLRRLKRDVGGSIRPHVAQPPPITPPTSAVGITIPFAASSASTRCAQSVAASLRCSAHVLGKLATTAFHKMNGGGRASCFVLQAAGFAFRALVSDAATSGGRGTLPASITPALLPADRPAICRRSLRCRTALPRRGTLAATASDRIPCPPPSLRQKRP